MGNFGQVELDVEKECGQHKKLENKRKDKKRKKIQKNID